MAKKKKAIKKWSEKDIRNILDFLQEAPKVEVSEKKKILL